MATRLATATNNSTTLSTIPGSTNVPASVPTKAPAVNVNQSTTNNANTVPQPNQQTTNQTSTPAFGFANADRTVTPAKPTTTVTSKDATNQLNNTIIPAMQAGQQAVQAQAQKQAAIKAAEPVPVPTPAVTQPAETPNEGNQYAYDAQGNKIEVPQGQTPPSGFSTTPPANPVLQGKNIVGQQVTGPDGSSYVQYNDGTYGRLNPDGSFGSLVQKGAYDQAAQSDPGVQMQNTVSKLENLNVGAIPLTAPQQTQVNAIQQQLQQNIAAQELANKNLVGGTTIAMNLYGMGNTLYGQGKIHEAINAGITAISKLQVTAADAIAKMQSTFQQQNYTDLASHYKDMISAQTAIQNHIDHIQTIAEQHARDIQTVANNLRTYNLEVKKEQDKLNQNAVSNKIAQQNADRNDKLAQSTLALHAAQISKIQDDIKINDYANGLGSGITGVGGGTDVIGSNGKPDPQKQAAYLQSIAAKNPGLALSVKGFAEYRLPVTSRTFTSKTGQALRDMIMTYDPTWDANNYAAKAAAVKDFSSGKSAQTIVSLNTAIQHLNVLAQDTQKLGNVNFLPANYLKNTLGKYIGLSPASGTKLAIAGETGELAKAFTGVGATDQEQKNLGTINANSTPADVKAYVQNAIDLLSGKLNSLNEQYVSQVGQEPPTPLLRQSTMMQLSNLKNEGYQVDIPGVYYTDPTAYAKNTPNAAANLTSARQVGQTHLNQPGIVSQAIKGIVSPVATMVARPVEAATELGAYALGGNEALANTDTALNEFAKNQLGGYVAPTPQNAADVGKDIGRGTETVALGLGPVAGGATYGAGQSVEQGNSPLSYQTAVDTALGAAGGKLLDTVGRPIFNVAGKVVGKVTPQYLQDLAGKGTQAIQDFAAQHEILPEPLSSGVNATADKIQNVGQKVSDTVDMPFNAAKGVITGNKILKPNQVDQYISDQYQKAVRPSVAGHGTVNLSDAAKAKQIDAVKAIVDNKPNLTITDKYGEHTGSLPKTIDEMRQAVNQTKQAIFQKYDALQKASGETGVQVDLKPITDELSKVLDNPVVTDLHPEVGNYVKYRIDALSKRGAYTPEQAQEAIKVMNDSLEAFYNNPSYDTASRAQVDALIANKLREGLDSTIENSQGPGYADLKRQYGAVRSIEKDVVHRSIVEGRKNTKGLLDMSDIASGAELLRGLVTMNPADLATSGAIKGIAAYQKYLNNPNTAVKNMFNAAEKSAVNGAVGSQATTGTAQSPEVMKTSSTTIPPKVKNASK